MNHACIMVSSPFALDILLVLTVCLVMCVCVCVPPFVSIEMCVACNSTTFIICMHMQCVSYTCLCVCTSSVVIPHCPHLRMGNSGSQGAVVCRFRKCSRIANIVGRLRVCIAGMWRSGRNNSKPDRWGVRSGIVVCVVFVMCGSWSVISNDSSYIYSME